LVRWYNRYKKEKQQEKRRKEKKKEECSEINGVKENGGPTRI
jgi:hypothetical protein